MNRMGNLELYIHIPFCVRKCEYCDFLSAPADRQVQSAYMEALLGELRGAGTAMRTDGRSVTSVFIGGGTPSVVEPQWIGRLMETVRENFALDADAEITIEMNPGTLSRKGLELYREAGINRLSIGLQSTDDAQLKALGRIHSYNQFLETYRTARQVGFDNVNVDLMAALPGESREDNLRNLREILRLEPAPEHISAYSLIVEEGTPFYELHRQGRLRLPEEELEREMYWDTVEGLEVAGYEHYEISNYAKPGFACRHNRGYWIRTDYLGFGLGAASLCDNMRYSNTRMLDEYIKHPTECHVERQALSREDRMAETMFLGLRLMEGVGEEHFKEEFGVELGEVYGDVIREGISDGLLEYRESHLVLTRRGIDLSNYIMAKFLL